MKKITKVNKGGFTLLELMVVIAIIVILSGITFFNFFDAKARHEATQSAAEDKFVTQFQSQTDHVRHSMLSGTPRYSATT